MITIKSKREIELMKKSGEILKDVKQIILKSIKVGISTLELDKIAYQAIIKHHAKPAFLNYLGYKYSICTSVNEQMIHGLPSKYKLQEGDLLKVDIGVKYQNYCTDSAFTIGVGKIKASDQKLIDVAERAFTIGVSQIKPGARVGDIEQAIGDYVFSQNLFVPSHYTGHGIGVDLHEDPSVHNQGQAKRGPLLKNGMTICIEPMILQDNDQVKTLNDGWTVVAFSGKNTSHYEETILIENGYPIILT